MSSDENTSEQVSLDALFLGAPADPVSPAHDVFVNRTSEIEIFREKYRLIHNPETHFDPSDLQTPRDNVIVYYGMGGIGKSRLTRRLEVAARSESLGVDVGNVTFRIDFQDSSFFDPEALVLSLRAAVGARSGIRMRAFDLALSVYWATKHPGESLKGFLDQSGWLARVTNNRNMSEGIANTMGDLLSASAVANASLRIGRRLVSVLRERRDTRSLLEQCPRLQEMLEHAETESLRLFLPYLLSWDLAQATGRSRLALTIFIDSFEEVQERSRGLCDMEDVVSRAIYLMPNTLFVISGRNRLRWGHPRGAAGRVLFYGPNRWRGLGDAGTHGDQQYLLGALSNEDARSYLEARFSTVGGVGELPLDELVEAAGGWPLYLDLQATRVERLVGRGEHVASFELEGGLIEAVVRIMRDLDEWERDLLRAAALATVVDESLLAASLPDVRESRITHFLELGFLAPGLDGRRSLNQALRQAVVEADGALEDHWSEQQWKRVAERIVQHLGNVIRSSDPAVVVSTLVDGFELGGRFDLEPGWLASAADAVFSRGAWDVLRTISVGRAANSSSLGPVALAVGGAVRRANGDTSGSLELTKKAASSLPKLRGELRDYVAWQLVASAERSGDRDTAAHYCREIKTPVFLARSLVRLGRLSWIGDDLLAAVEYATRALREGPLPGLSGSHSASSNDVAYVTSYSLLGWVRFTQGRLNEAEAAFRLGLNAAEGSGNRFFIASELCHVALILAVQRSDIASELVRKARSEAERVGTLRQLAQARCADSLLVAERGDLTAALSELADVASALNDAGDHLDVRLPLFISTIINARSGRFDAAAENAKELELLGKHYRAHRCLGVIASAIAGYNADTLRSAVKWGDEYELVRSRWLTTVNSKA